MMIIYYLLFIFLLSVIFIKLIMKNATDLGLSDIPNDRSSHTTITPRGAGIGFGGAFFLSNFIFNFSFFIENGLVFLSIFLVFLIGILDDHKDASPKAKFYVIMVATLLVFFDDIAIYSLGSFFGYEISLWYLSLPFTIFALAGFTNALNLIDGLDGLATSVSIIILSSFLYIGYVNQDELIITITSSIIVGLVAFLFFNWNPASIFMGDSGSLFIGFIISLVAVISTQYIHPITVLYLGAIPILDTVVVMVRRIKKGLSPFSPDKTHIHHILLRFFSKKVKKTVLFIILIQILFSLVGVMLALNSDKLSSGISSFIALIAFIGITIFFYMIFTGMQKRQKLIEKLSNRKKKNKK